jgi:hypothetical protein
MSACTLLNIHPTSLPFDVPLPKILNFEASEALFNLSKNSMVRLVTGFRRLIKKIKSSEEELRPISEMLRDVETQMLLTITTNHANVVSIRKSSIFRILNTYRLLVKQVSFEVEELETMAQVYYDIVDQITKKL